MWYRVLALTLLCCAPLAALGAQMPHVDLVKEHGIVIPASLTAEIQALNLAGSAPSPFFPENGNEMWDPLGAGCVEVTDPVAWLPSGRRDPEAGALCLPRPCARPLTEDEMERGVLGRPLREGEWDTYTERYSRACATEVMWEPGAETAIGLLPQEPVSWTEAAFSGDLAVNQIGGATNGRGRPAKGFSRGGSGGFGGGLPSARGGRDLMSLVKSGAPQSNRAEPTTGTFDPGKGDTPQRNPSGDNGTPDGEDAGPSVPQPTPVPLPGSLLMLTVAVAALRLPRR